MASLRFHKMIEATKSDLYQLPTLPLTIDLTIFIPTITFIPPVFENSILWCCFQKLLTPEYIHISISTLGLHIFNFRLNNFIWISHICLKYNLSECTSSPNCLFLPLFSMSILGTKKYKSEIHPWLSTSSCLHIQHNHSSNQSLGILLILASNTSWT